MNDIVDAIGRLATEEDSGKPTASAVGKEVGRRVSAAERDEAWEAFVAARDADAQGDEQPDAQEEVAPEGDEQPDAPVDRDTAVLNAVRDWEGDTMGSGRPRPRDVSEVVGFEVSKRDVRRAFRALQAE